MQIKLSLLPCSSHYIISVFNQKKKVFNHAVSNAKVDSRVERGREERKGFKGGEISEKRKVEKENRECTCNLTVVKGTPHRESNKTKVKRTCLEGGS